MPLGPNLLGKENAEKIPRAERSSKYDLESRAQQPYDQIETNQDRPSHLRPVGLKHFESLSPFPLQSYFTAREGLRQNAGSLAERDTGRSGKLKQGTIGSVADSPSRVPYRMSARHEKEKGVNVQVLLRCRYSRTSSLFLRYLW